MCYTVFYSAGTKMFSILEDPAPMFKISVWIVICDAEIYI